MHIVFRELEHNFKKKKKWETKVCYVFLKEKEGSSPFLHTYAPLISVTVLSFTGFEGLQFVS